MEPSFYALLALLLTAVAVSAVWLALRSRGTETSFQLCSPCPSLSIPVRRGESPSKGSVGHRVVFTKEVEAALHDVEYLREFELADGVLRLAFRRAPEASAHASLASLQRAVTEAVDRAPWWLREHEVVHRGLRFELDILHDQVRVSAALPSRIEDWNTGSMAAGGDAVVSQFLKVDENLDATLEAVLAVVHVFPEARIADDRVSLRTADLDEVEPFLDAAVRLRDALSDTPLTPPD